MSGLGASGSKLAFWLLADTEFADYVAIAVGIVRLQVIQQAAALADQHQQSTPRGMVLLVDFEVLGQFANPLTQNRDLDFRRAGVCIVSAEAFNQGCFLGSRQHGVCCSSCLLSPLSSVYCETTMNARPRAIRNSTGTQKQTRAAQRTAVTAPPPTSNSPEPLSGLRSPAQSGREWYAGRGWDWRG